MRAFILALTLGCCIAGTANAADTRLFSADDLKAICGEYDLSDGRRLTVSQRSRKLYVQVDGRPAVEVAPAGGTVFEAPSGRMRVEFDRSPNGVVAGVRLELRAGPG